MFGWAKRARFCDEAIRKANEKEQLERSRNAFPQIPPRQIKACYTQRELEIKMMQRADEIRRAERKKILDKLDDSFNDLCKEKEWMERNWAKRTLIQVDTGETRIYKNINGEEVLVAHYENRVYGRDDNRL